MSLIAPVHELFAGLEHVQASLGAALFQIVKMKLSINKLNKYIELSISNLNNVYLSGGRILDSVGTLQRMNETSNWKEGLILSLEELKGAMPYIEKSIEELTRNAQVAQNHAEVTDRIARVLKKSVSLAEVNQRWNQIDVIQLTAFNTAMAKLMSLMVTTNSRAADLFDDMKNLFEIFTGMNTYLNHTKSKGNLDKLASAKELVTSLINASKSLIEEVSLTRDIFKNTKSAPLLHPQTLNLPLKFGSKNANVPSISNLSHLAKLVRERRRKSPQRY